MKKFSKLLALLLAAVLAFSMSLTAFAAAEESESEEDIAVEETVEEDGEEDGEGSVLVYATSTFDQKFSPFFYTTVYDGEVCDMFTASFGAADRGGAPIEDATEGVTLTYNGTDYEYEGIGAIEVVQNDDGTVDYNLTMRDDIVFSDGEPATIDDVIFGIYVQCDPTYDGSATLYALPIIGMDEYRSGMTSLANAILEDVVAQMLESDEAAYEENDVYTEEQFEEYVAAFMEAGTAFAQEIIDYVVENYGEDYAPAYDLTVEDLEDETTACYFGMDMWGFGDAYEDGFTAPDYFVAMVRAYDGDVASMESTEAVSLTVLGATLDALDPAYQVGVSTGDGAANIEGIEKTGDYTMTIHMDEFDATAIYNVNGLLVAPMHWYGDPELYDYENDSFGFVKGDLSGVKAKTAEPLGCGPYIFEGYENGVATLKANELYFKGVPQIDTILFQESVDSDYVPGIVSGSFDIASPSINESTLNAIKDANGDDEIVGDCITTYLVDYRGYGYIGVSAANVNINDEPDSDESKALRKGFMTLFAVYRDAVINSYYGDRASVIQYPISNTSWAAPKPADEGYALAYSKDADGNDIYDDSMTDEEKYEAAKAAAITWFQAAGFTYDEAEGKFVDVEDTYEFMIPGQGQQDHPAYGVVDAASQVLEELGIKLQINDVATSVWSSALDANTAMMWAAAWQSTVDPDMTQVYTSQNFVTGTNSNHYAIQDETLDELIAEGRQSADTEERKSIYKECMEIIMDWGVELPTYQRKDCITVSTERVDTDTVPGDLTPYWGVFSEIETLAVK